MATNEISDVVTTNGLLVPTSVPYRSQQSKSSYIARIALFAALTVSSVLPYQANANQSTSPEVNKRIRLEEERKKAELKKQNEKPNQDFDILKTLEKKIDPKGENTKPATNKNYTKKVKPANIVNAQTKKQEKELSSLRRWYDLTQAAGLETRGDYGALGVSGGRFKRGQEGGVSGDPSQREEIGLVGIVGRELKPLDLKERNIVLRIVGRLYPDSISAKAAGSTETDGDGSTGSLRVTPAYTLGKKIVLVPIAQYRKEDTSTIRYQETNKLETGARISFEISPETLLYLIGSSGNGRWDNGKYGPNSASGSTSSKDMEAGLRLELSEDASMEAGIRKTDTNYTGLKGENFDGISEVHLRLAKEVNDFLVSIGGAYIGGKFQADDLKTLSSRKVDSVTGEASLQYRLSNGFLQLTGVMGHKAEEVSVGFVYPIGNSDKK